MNGLTAAKGLRRSVENAGGTMRISVNALGDVFGRGRMTGRARAGIEAVLARAGVEVQPGLREPPADGWVTLRLAPGAAEPPSGSRGTPPVAALVVVLALLLAGAAVLPSGGSDPEPEPTAAAAPPRADPPAAAEEEDLDRARRAVADGDYHLAVDLVRAHDPALVPAMRAQIAAALLFEARVAERDGAHTRTIELARRAARYGPAPGAARLVRAARAGLERRASAMPAPSATPPPTDAG